jgi:Fe2+ or Zn2+ uptake regulation protein
MKLNIEDVKKEFITAIKNSKLKNTKQRMQILETLERRKFLAQQGLATHSNRFTFFKIIK